MTCFNDLKTAVNFKEVCHKSQKILLANSIDDKTNIKFYDPDDNYEYEFLQDDLIEEVEEGKIEVKLEKQTFEVNLIPEPAKEIEEYDCESFQDDLIEKKTKIDKKPKTKTPKRSRKENLANPLQCEVCGKICVNLGVLKSHKLTAHEGQRTEICEFCNKGFILKYQLQRHLNIHLNKRQYKCDFGSCQSGFNDRTGLRSHRFICPERTDVIEKPHECKICNKTFPFPARLRDHMQMYHLGSKKFGCEECEKVFSRP